MVDTIFNLIFGCHHRHLTRPITPVDVMTLRKRGGEDRGTYVACLDCGKRFQYDAANMRVGRQIEEAIPASMAPFAR
jgi:hypothetical protein